MGKHQVWELSETSTKLYINEFGFSTIRRKLLFVHKDIHYKLPKTVYYEELSFTQSLLNLWPPITTASEAGAGILKQFIQEVRNRVGIGCRTGPPGYIGWRIDSLESISELLKCLKIPPHAVANLRWRYVINEERRRLDFPWSTCLVYDPALALSTSFNPGKVQKN
jgi:hypothetical protein